MAPKNKPLVVSVPSGNFGNLCAGMMAQQMGLPISHFIASTNRNKVVPEYLKSGDYQPRQTIATLSNAMDVGAPSNFVRIQEIVKNNLEALRKRMSGYSFDDQATKAAMQKLYTDHAYIADPHGAVGYLGLYAYLKTLKTDAYGLFLETAHPIKFHDVVKDALGLSLEIPKALKPLMNREKKAHPIKNYDDLKSFLTSPTP